jgi:hypothetical protein
LQVLRSTSASGPGFKRVVKLIVPLRSGDIVRSDIIPARLQDSKYAEPSLSFAEPLQTYNGQPVLVSDQSDFTTLFSAAAAGLLLYQDSEDSSNAKYEALSLAAELDLENRLSFPWILPETPQRKTLAIVDAGSSNLKNGFGVYRAAIDLKINVVVLDNPGRWLKDPKYAHWRDAFIPTRLMNPPGEMLVNAFLHLSGHMENRWME